jgi:hypothetical protein
MTVIILIVFFIILLNEKSRSQSGTALKFFIIKYHPRTLGANDDNNIDADDIGI